MTKVKLYAVCLHLFNPTQEMLTFAENNEYRLLHDKKDSVLLYGNLEYLYYFIDMFYESLEFMKRK